MKRLKALLVAIALFLAPLAAAMASTHVMKYVDPAGVVLRLHSEPCADDEARAALSFYGVPDEVLLTARVASVFHKGKRHDGCYVVTPDGQASFSVIPSIGPGPVVIPMGAFKEEHKI